MAGLMNGESLAAKSCVPCRGGVAPLTEVEARALQRQTPLWELAEKATRLTRAFEFADFVAAMRFVNRVAEVAEAEGHHPDIAIHWNKVDLVLWTHKIGGLHENDFILAAKIDRLLEEPSRPTGAVLAG
jgi:4a-hydroxytetrahydrobiopterin dehydratase